MGNSATRGYSFVDVRIHDPFTINYIQSQENNEYCLPMRIYRSWQSHESPWDETMDIPSDGCSKDIDTTGFVRMDDELDFLCGKWWCEANSEGNEECRLKTYYANAGGPVRNCAWRVLDRTVDDDKQALTEGLKVQILKMYDPNDSKSVKMVDPKIPGRSAWFDKEDPYCRGYKYQKNH